MFRDFFGLLGGKRTKGCTRAPRILLFESEAVRIARYALSSPRLEIGGDLLGFYAPDGSPLVFVASGPGPAARGDATHFQQDPEFQALVFNQLASQFRMFYLGDWHSHHGLGLSDPSVSDDAKLQDLASRNGWPQLFSLIVQTGGVSARLDYRTGGRDEIRRDPDMPWAGGPIEAFGVSWSAFQYVFAEPERSRRRVAVEFQSGDNPHEALSDGISSAVGRGHCPWSHEARGESRRAAQTTRANHRTAGAALDEEFAVSTYQEICRVLSGELRVAQMEVDLEHLGGACLVVLNDGEKVVCGIGGISDGSLEVTVDPTRGDQVKFRVPCPRGRVDAIDIRAIARQIVEQFRPRTGTAAPKTEVPDAKRAPESRGASSSDVSARKQGED
jgi:hypothetical protein